LHLRFSETVAEILLLPVLSDKHGLNRLAEQIVSIYAGTRGHLDDIPVSKVREFEIGLLSFLRDRKPEVIRKIQDVADLTPEVEELIKSTIAAFKATFR
jgi:F-type H+-transporting ATPase subunit alpha